MMPRFGGLCPFPPSLLVEKTSCSAAARYAVGAGAVSHSVFLYSLRSVSVSGLPLRINLRAAWVWTASVNTSKHFEKQDEKAAGRPHRSLQLPGRRLW